MVRFFIITLVLGALTSANAQKSHDYPVTPRDSTVDVYFNDKISDPYQWMENSEDVRLPDWLAEQTKITDKNKKRYTNWWVLRNQIATMYNSVRTKELSTYREKEDSLKSKYEFDFKNDNSNRAPDLTYRVRGQKNYRRLVRIKDFMIDKEDNVAITNRYLNEDDNLIAVEISHNGGDWREVFFFNLLTGEQLIDRLSNLRVSSNIIWQGKDVIYDSYNKAEPGRALLDKATGQKLYYHKLGQNQSEDKLLYQNGDTSGTNSFTYFKLNDKLFFKHYYTVKGTIYRALSVANVNSESFYLTNFLLYPNSPGLYVSIEELFGNTAILNTNWDASNGRVLAADITALNKVSELVGEYDILLSKVNKLGKDKIACIYTDKGKNIALIFNTTGELLRKIDFPEGKQLNYFYENEDSATHTDFCVSSFFHPKIWYQLTLSDLTFKPIQVLSVPYKVETLETRYINYKSKDGTEIPMYISCLKDTKLDGSNPTLLRGYGGYGTTIVPSFDESLTLWLLHGGIIAVPNVRGGGAKGSDWGLAGRRLNKQVAIDDFIAAAEYLISEKYTNTNKLAINGGSHGGLLVGAAYTQRPELFKAAIAQAGAFDMLRFSEFTVGSVNTNLNEFGTPSIEEDYLNLKSYSPLHNIKDNVNYPNLMLITGKNDDRVPPLHSYKFLATLQEKGSDESLYSLLLIDGTGHGGALNNKDFEKLTLYKYAFLFDQLEVKID
ncbi:prolyl oligopeptidase family serine peptidase [Psychroserpens sp. NJDZ02]|uniref:prolyl oligopeptidase family serine peptidase n=1 Tax=Psychroserpens sp. NJDZ02 TaxID=2570561 RepID=UPI0010A7ACE1|nr:prolyl oligopeptidase family serine peptidase [Psychroserpens sp. NJDZ02]QCE39958.1 S9 family peptidase [Psychroserpens sp. NJDZ02]